MSEEDNLIREVEEDLRRERYERLWKKFGPYVIGIIAVVLVSMLGWQQWHAWQQRQREQESERFMAAVDLMQDGKEAAAANAFGELAGKAGPGYRAVARLHEAEAYLKQGNPDRALAAFDALAADNTVNSDLRALAALKGALLLADSSDPAKLKKRLTMPLRPGSPWRFAAQELVAYAYYRAGQFDEARNNYQTLVNEYDAPSHIRERARNMLSLIGSEEAQGKGVKKAKAQTPPSKDAGKSPSGQTADTSADSGDESGETTAETGADTKEEDSSQNDAANNEAAAKDDQ